MSLFSSVDAVSADIVSTFNLFANASLARRNKPSGRPPFHRLLRAGANFEERILSMAVSDASDASLNSFLCTIFRKIAASSEACVETASTQLTRRVASLMTRETPSRRCDVNLKFGNGRKRTLSHSHRNL